MAKTPEEVRAEAAQNAEAPPAAPDQPVVDAPVRPRRRLQQSPLAEGKPPEEAVPPTPPDAMTGPQAMAAMQARMDAADFSTMNQEQLNALETSHAVERRLRAEQEDEELRQMSFEAQQRDLALQAEHEQLMEEHNKRVEARRAATPEDALPTPEGMVRVVMMKNCSLVRDDGTMETYTTTGSNCGIPGTYDMPEDDANHWYIIAHSDNPPPPLAPQPGTFAARAIAERTAARRALIEMSLTQEEQQAANELRQNRHDRLKAALGETYERQE